MEKRSGLLEACRRIHAFVLDDKQTALSLSGLELTAIPSSGLDELASSRGGGRLLRLDLANNALDDLPDRFVDVCPNLQILFCLSNSFETIPKCLARSTSLFMLSFKSCRLHGELDASSLPPNLAWLILTDNRLTSLSSAFGQRARHVRKLMLANNFLQELPDNMMTSGMSESLELLRLSNNRLEFVPECLFTANKLAWLGLGGNPCSAPSVQSLDELDSRVHIDLSDYRLESTPSLGTGASGDVYLAAKRESSGEFRYAVKVYKGMKSSDGNVLDEVKATLALRSVAGLIPVLGYFGPETINAMDQRFGVVMEAVMDVKVLGGTPSFSSITRDVYPADGLFSRIESVLVIGIQIARVAQQIHKRGYSHGDLYGHNILVDKDSKCKCLLTDLGAAYPYCDSRIEFVEVRAFGCLLDELIDATLESAEDLNTRAAVAELAIKCIGDIADRPRFQQIVQDLEDMTLRFQN
jgi:hypothetical protein